MLYVWPVSRKTSVNTSTASQVTSGPMPSPAVTRIFRCMSVLFRWESEFCQFVQGCAQFIQKEDSEREHDPGEEEIEGELNKKTER